MSAKAPVNLARDLANQFRLIVPTLAALTIGAGFWLNIVYGMRVKELQYRLRNNSDQQQAVRTLSLISRYQLLRQKAGERDQALNYGREGRLMQALQHTAATETTPDLSPGEITALWTIEFFNLLAASPRFKYEQTTPEYQALERAFFFELRRNYAAAVERYDWVLGRAARLGDDWYSYAKLHRAFCYALSNERAKARADLEDIIRKNNEGEYRLTAQALLAMVSEIDHELVKVELMLPSADKGAAYYKLTAYDKAIQTFKGLANINANPSAMFYLGRSHEESGNNTQAAEHYRKIIALHAKTEWAVKANRRLFAMGAFYTAGQEYRHESKSNVEKKIVTDPGLLNESKRYEKVALHIENLESQKTKENPRVAVAAPIPVAAAPAVIPPSKPVAIPPPKREMQQAKKPQHPESVANVSEPVREIAAPGAQTKPAVPPIAAEPVASVQPKPEPSAIELAKTWEQKEALNRKDKAKYLRTQKFLVRVTMEDGNQFTGVLMRETATEIFLFTVMGKIAVDKAQIAEREKIRQ